ncbi:uncharacterized protein LOC117526046 isoform X2 [Thalassophryne amazonica]|uniref:uncharacterized protein LOC117526046 isoform X1 n=1 Tax=Thalassophryne amazonica TaxID=390379 RepID=UPI0014724477|nr:uncharacterized protein LOC117526046 isoform X1 [Thalassophryne amazonica]XP_034043926.1 uncharacterized protein LOC117526046 isoform X2 [Thalassophryne amazonica]
MVQWQLGTLEHLMKSGFGCPFPRHGLQLLFWFANNCVTCKLDASVMVVKLVSDCQPELGVFGFHRFGNAEALLPVLSRTKKKKTKREGQVEYYEVGNLNTQTYPDSANLPTYVREQYELNVYSSKCNTDRLIIRYQVRTKVVETMYVTEHDANNSGGFSFDKTYEISPELIEALQSSQLDITTFLTQMGYYGDIEMAYESEQINWPERSAQQMLQAYHGASASMGQMEALFSQIFNQKIDTEPVNYDQHIPYNFNLPSPNSHFVVDSSTKQSARTKSNKKQKALVKSYWVSSWNQPKGSGEEAKKWTERTFVKVLLSAGALYLAIKCFSWLKSSWKMLWSEGHTITPPFTQVHRNTPIMLDYVY